MSFDLAQATDEFWQARQRGEFFPQAWFDRLTLDQAYAIQLALIDRRVAQGEKHIGWKVGLTAKPIQEQFGFHEPVFGCILESVASGATLRADALIAPGFESELCLRMGATPCHHWSNCLIALPAAAASSRLFNLYSFLMLAIWVI